MSTGAKSVSEPEPITDNTYKWHDGLDLEPQGFSSNVDDRFFGEDSPNKPPVFNVDVKLAADITITDDPELVDEVGEYWFPEGHDRFNQVAIVVFNDASVWHIPLADWDKDYERFRDDIVERYISDIVQWKAVVNNEDPAEALSRFKDEVGDKEVEWAQKLGDTEMTEEQREWFNDNARWLDHIERTVKARQKDVELDVDDDEQWADDW